MKISSLSLPAAVAALFAAAILAAAAVAQAPQTAPAQLPAVGSPPPEHHYPTGTNLKVLPKTLTGEQLHEIMEGWADALGAHCNTCHTADPTKIGPNGRPQLDFPDDTKPEKSTARLMVKMVQDINGNYISMVDNSGAPVACGTCHRGHLSPEPFVAPPKGPPPATPPAGIAPSPQPK